MGTLSLGRAPKSAAGPDLRQLVLGSEGALGVITSLTLAVSPAPERRVYEGWRLPDVRGRARAVVRRLAQDGPRPTVLRLVGRGRDGHRAGAPVEIARRSAAPASAGCLAIVGWEGTESRCVEAPARHCRAADAGPAASRSPAPARAGPQGASAAPYLRDALLDAGALVETLETVAFWSTLPGLYAAVAARAAQTLTGLGTPPVILCHISHVYPAGASLYFTVACAQLPDPVAQWRAAKAAAGEAILAAGASITHHHGVGVDHRELL